MESNRFHVTRIFTDVCAALMLADVLAQDARARGDVEVADRAQEASGEARAVVDAAIAADFNLSSAEVADASLKASLAIQAARACADDPSTVMKSFHKYAYFMDVKIREETESEAGKTASDCPSTE